MELYRCVGSERQDSIKWLKQRTTKGGERNKKGIDTHTHTQKSKWEKTNWTEEMIIAIKNLFAFHLNGALHTLTQAQCIYTFAEKKRAPLIVGTLNVAFLHTIFSLSPTHTQSRSQLGRFFNWANILIAYYWGVNVHVYVYLQLEL